MVAAILSLEPFAARYEGKTVRQWIAICMEDRTKVDERLVMGFGSSATPELLAMVRRMHSTFRTVQKTGSDGLASFVLNKLKYREKLMVVAEWLALAHFLGEPVLGKLCELQDYSSVMLILSHVDEPTLNLYREQKTDTFLRQVAESEHSSRWSGGVLRLPGPFQNFEQTLKRVKESRSSVAKDL